MIPDSIFCCFMTNQDGSGGLNSIQSLGPVASRAELYTTFLQSNGHPKVHKFSAKLKNIRSEQGT